MSEGEKNGMKFHLTCKLFITFQVLPGMVGRGFVPQNIENQSCVTDKLKLGSSDHNISFNTVNFNHIA